jgi:hypothetical protein
VAQREGSNRWTAAACAARLVLVLVLLVAGALTLTRLPQIG